MHMHHYNFGTEASLREKRMIFKGTNGPEDPKKIELTPTASSAADEELKALIAKLNLEQKGQLRNVIEEALANDGQVVGEEIIAFSAAVREQISKFPEVREKKTLAQIDALMQQLPNNYDSLIAYAMSAGLLTQAELGNINFRAGQRNASPGTPERGPEGKVSLDILERRIEDAKTRMKTFESARVSMIRDYHANMYSVPRNQRAAYYRKVTGTIRNMRNAGGNPVADYWKARKQWEAAARKSYVRHLREQRGDAMASGPETERESYNYKIVDRNTGTTIASYRQWTGDYIGSGLSRDEAIRIIESSDPTSISGRNAIIEIDGTQYLRESGRTELAMAGDGYGRIIANAPTDSERRRRWAYGVDPLSRASLDRQRVAARLGFNPRESSFGESTDHQASLLHAASEGRLDYVNSTGTYAVLKMKRSPYGRNTAGRRYPTPIARVTPTEYSLSVPRMSAEIVKEQIRVFKEDRVFNYILTHLWPQSSSTDIAKLIDGGYQVPVKDRRVLYEILTKTCADAKKYALTIDEAFLRTIDGYPPHRTFVEAMIATAKAPTAEVTKQAPEPAASKKISPEALEARRNMSEWIKKNILEGALDARIKEPWFGFSGKETQLILPFKKDEKAISIFLMPGVDGEVLVDSFTIVTNGNSKQWGNLKNTQMTGPEIIAAINQAVVESEASLAKPAPEASKEATESALDGLMTEFRLPATTIQRKMEIGRKILEKSYTTPAVAIEMVKAFTDALNADLDASIAVDLSALKARFNMYVPKIRESKGGERSTEQTAAEILDEEEATRKRVWDAWIRIVGTSSTEFDKSETTPQRRLQIVEELLKRGKTIPVPYVRKFSDVLTQDLMAAKDDKDTSRKIALAIAHLGIYLPFDDRAPKPDDKSPLPPVPGRKSAAKTPAAKPTPATEKPAATPAQPEPESAPRASADLQKVTALVDELHTIGEALPVDGAERNYVLWVINFYQESVGNNLNEFGYTVANKTGLDVYLMLMKDHPDLIKYEEKTASRLGIKFYSLKASPEKILPVLKEEVMKFIKNKPSKPAPANPLDDADAAIKELEEKTKAKPQPSPLDLEVEEAEKLNKK